MVKVAGAPAFDFRIHVDGQPTQEFDDPDVETTATSVSKYIESISNAPWAVEAVVDSKKLRDPHVAWTVYLLCDGQPIQGYVIFDPKFHKRDCKRGRRVRETIADHRYVKDGHWCKQAFSFGDVKTTEMSLTEVHKQLIPKLSALGSITLQLWRETGERPVACDSQAYKPDTRTDDLPEKALKGRTLSHKFTLAAPVAIPPEKLFKSERLDAEPTACYTFKYLSKSCLQAIMIIPRDPSPSPPEDNNDDLDNLSPEELRAQLRAVRARESSAPDILKHELIRNLKREATTVDDDDLTITSTRNTKAARTEAIDLTL